MKIDYSIVAAIAAVVSSIIAIFAIISESKRSRFALGMDLLFKINDQFNHPDFTKKRIIASKFILKLKDKSNLSNWTCAEVDDILDFFQAIASLTERGALDEEIVWEYYSYWLHNYYEVSKEYIKMTQKEYPQTWEGVELLQKKFIKIEDDDYKHIKRKYTSPSEEEMKQFLLDESKLRIN